MRAVGRRNTCESVPLGGRHFEIGMLTADTEDYFRQIYRLGYCVIE